MTDKNHEKPSLLYKVQMKKNMILKGLSVQMKVYNENEKPIYILEKI